MYDLTYIDIPRVCIHDIVCVMYLKETHSHHVYATPYSAIHLSTIVEHFNFRCSLYDADRAFT